MFFDCNCKTVQGMGVCNMNHYVISWKTAAAMILTILVASHVTIVGAAEFTKVMQPGRYIPGSGKPCGFDLKPHWDDFKKGRYHVAEEFAFGLLLGGMVVQKGREKESNKWLRFRDVAFFIHHEDTKKHGKHYRWRKDYKDHFLVYWQEIIGITDNYRTCLKRDQRNCWDLAHADGIVDNYDEFVRKWDEIIGDSYDPTCLEWEPE